VTFVAEESGKRKTLLYMVFVYVVRIFVIGRVRHHTIHQLPQCPERIACDSASMCNIRVVPIVTVRDRVELERRLAGDGEYVASARVIVDSESTIRVATG
jgi:hypothetical protein